MNIDYLGTVFFLLALIHTFIIPLVSRISHKFKKGSFAAFFFHLMSEVEIVFGFWAVLFLMIWTFTDGILPVISYQKSLNFSEPLFIFCIMMISSTRPVITISRKLILGISRILEKIFKIDNKVIQFFSLLTLGPLLGSIITEPAAITITALLLYRMIDKDKIDTQLLYGITALLFVNVSVGGALTHFAAPPILIVARTWSWSLSDVFFKLGVAAVLSIISNNLIFILLFKQKITRMLSQIEVDHYPMPIWIVILQLLIMTLLVVASHNPMIFSGLFLVFLGLVSLTRIYQDELKYKESFKVALFLVGLIEFGAFQKWWLEPLMLKFNEISLFVAAVGLTGITDNAALTYLGSQVAGLTEISKWALVAGAVVGGGLTILANAPNPAGFTILCSKFPDSSLNAFQLFKAALLPTSVAFICFFLKVIIFS